MKQNGFAINRRLYCLLLLLFIIAGKVSAQGGASINPEDPGFRAKYETLAFNNKFVLLAESDPTNNYYIADFSTFSSKFEKVYFLSLVFVSGKVVNIDGNLKYNRIWFLASKKFTEQESLEEFEKLKELTIMKASSMTVQEQSQWLLENDKYK